jgi:hypothetical protein
MKSNRFFSLGYVSTISAILVASLLFAGISPTISADGAMMDSVGQNANMMAADKMTGNSMMAAGEHHLVKGQISNVQLDSSGKPEWIQSGIWIIRVTFGENNAVDAAQLVARFAMVKPDGTAMHIHMIYAFKASEFSTEQNGTVYVLKGTATITMKDGPVSDVPLTIKIFNKAVIGFWIGPDKVDSHFGSHPIYGTLWMGSRTTMMAMGSMMQHGGMMMGGMMEQNLTKTNVPVTLPLTPGYANGHKVFYISTEASDKDLAALMTNWTGARVVYAPSLANTPPAALSNIYAFKNGVQGSGPLGFQPNVADSEPEDSRYSPLWRLILVEWKQGTTPSELKSEQEIIAAVQDGKVTIEPTKMIVNCPFVQWEGGSLMLRSDNMLTDKSPYGPGQVLNVDIENLKVTFVAHRGFAPDGSTIYYIATDASNPDVAKALGVLFVNKTSATTLSGASSDLYVFTNGIKGTGPMGYQASIAGSNVGQPQYSPIWRINAATWNDPSSVKFLTTTSQVGMAASNGMLDTEIAGFVVNCPFVEVGKT